jgi:hypothetical protein
MKALSVREPWAWLLLQPAEPGNPDDPIKKFENRSWPLPAGQYGQRVYIHASMQMDDFNPDILKSWMTAEQWACTAPELQNIYAIDNLNRNNPELLRKSGYFGCLMGEVTFIGQVTRHPSPWFSGPYGFIAKKPVLYPPEKRTVCKGQVGFWEVGT